MQLHRETSNLVTLLQDDGKAHGSNLQSRTITLDVIYKSGDGILSQYKGERRKQGSVILPCRTFTCSSTFLILYFFPTFYKRLLGCMQQRLEDHNVTVIFTNRIIQGLPGT